MWQKELTDKYIQLFETREVEGKQIPLRGIEVGAGWKEPTEILLKKLEWIRTHNTIDDKPNEIQIFQIKEKWGCFECYLYVVGSTAAERQADEAVAYAQGMASCTCEGCGRVGNTDGTMPSHTKSGWIILLCDACKNKK